jgi:hypothetical protein
MIAHRKIDQAMQINNDGQQYPRLAPGGRSLVWSRTSACHADDPGSNLGDRTKITVRGSVWQTSVLKKNRFMK